MPISRDDRQAARHVLVHAHARPDRELVDELGLELVRTIGGQRSETGCRRPDEHHHRVVPQPADVRAGAPVLVRLRQTRVVAIQAAPQVAAAQVPVRWRTASRTRTRRCRSRAPASAARTPGRERELGQALARVGDDVDLVPVGVERSRVSSIARSICLWT